MKSSAIWLLALCLAASTAAQGKSYTPIGINGPTINRGAFLPVKIADRPVLPGIRPVEVELLEDALRRKMNITIGDSREKAHQKIIRNSLRDPMKRSHIKGLLAEALFLEKNPGWGYVRKTNAPQVDVYVLRKGMRPWGAQIKTHISGTPHTYANDMLTDNRADRFLVPDDHVASLREHWQAQAGKHESAGRTAEAIEARRQLSRIGGVGFKSEYLDQSYSRVTRYAKREQYAGYVSLGAAVGLMLGTELWNTWQEGALTDQAALRTVHGGSILAAERAMTHVMTRNARVIPSSSTASPSGLGSSVLRGGLRGNAIVGATILAVDTAFAVYEHGGRRAFDNDAFYAGFGGSVSAFVVGMTAGQAVASWTVNPYAGFLVGTATGMAAYIAGQDVLSRILRILDEENLCKKDDVIYEAARESMDRRLKENTGSITNARFPNHRQVSPTCGGGMGKQAGLIGLTRSRQTPSLEIWSHHT
jgi:hypothetical protein